MNRLDYHLEPLVDIHLHSDMVGEFEPGGNAGIVYLLSAVAVLVLLIACVNFINLLMARSSERAREIGVRRVLGADRRDLILQFLAESILISALAMVAAFLLAWAILPAFQSLAGEGWKLQLGIKDVVAISAAVLIVALLAGGYPAFALSRIGVVRALKGEIARSLSGARFRQGLVLFQFTICIALVAVTLIMWRQLDYVRSKDLGFDNEHVISVPVPGAGRNVRRLVPLFTGLPGVKNVTADSRRPGFWAKKKVRRENASYDERLLVNYFDVASNFTEVMDIEVLHGRSFTVGMATDSVSGVLLNETAARQLGWRSSAAAVDERLLQGFDTELKVIGVVRDFHYASLHEAIEPLMMQARTTELSRILLSVLPDMTPTAIGALTTTWRRILPDLPFSYSFLDDAFAEAYRSDKNAGRMFGAFSAVAVFIACLGLLSLISFATVRRTQEIAVRKVLGASTSGIILLLSKEFLRMFAIAFILAVPAAYIAINAWLTEFAYRTNIGPIPFLLAGGIALLIAALTVSYQTLRAAAADPVQSLRLE